MIGSSPKKRRAYFAIEPVFVDTRMCVKPTPGAYSPYAVMRVMSTIVYPSTFSAWPSERGCVVAKPLCVFLWCLGTQTTIILYGGLGSEPLACLCYSGHNPPLFFAVDWDPNHNYFVCGGLGPTPQLFCRLGSKPPLFVGVVWDPDHHCCL